jgi:hypothetical protein
MQAAAIEDPSSARGRITLTLDIAYRDLVIDVDVQGRHSWPAVVLLLTAL